MEKQKIKRKENNNKRTRMYILLSIVSYYIQTQGREYVIFTQFIRARVSACVYVFVCVRENESLHRGGPRVTLEKL